MTHDFPVLHGLVIQLRYIYIHVNRLYSGEWSPRSTSHSMHTQSIVAVHYKYITCIAQDFRVYMVYILRVYYYESLMSYVRNNLRREHDKNQLSTKDTFNVPIVDFPILLCISEEKLDNLSTKDKLAHPNVSINWRFHFDSRVTDKAVMTIYSSRVIAELTQNYLLIAVIPFPHH